MTRTTTRDRAAAAVVRPLQGADDHGRLTDGWEPHRPLSDSLVRRFVYAHASSFAGPVAAMGGRVVRRDGYVLHDLGRPAGYFNGVTLLQPLSFDGWQAAIGAIRADVGGGASGEVLLWSAWPTPDLSGDGWELVGHPPLLLLPRPELSPPAPAWLRIEAVTDAQRLADWERVAVEGYPFTDCASMRPGAFVDDRLLGDPSFRAWVGYADGEPITIGTSYLVHGIDVFTLGVTLPEHRGRGAWRAMADRRLAAAPRLPAMALFSDMSRPPAERLGFLPLSRWTVWSLPRNA